MDTSCATFRAIYLQKQDILTDKTTDAVLAHNEAGAAKCGWKPVRKGKSKKK